MSTLLRHLPISRLLVAVAVALCAVTSASAGGKDPASRYLIQPGDVVEVKYRYSPEFDQTAAVQPDGYVTLAIGGELKLGGLTVDEGHAVVEAVASTRLNKPEVTLVLKEFQLPYFVIAGEVAQPGRFEMREPTTAIQAVLLAGGMKNTAKSSQIVVFRKINSDLAEVKIVNLKKITKPGSLEEDIALEAGDMLLVPVNTLTKIERFMKLANIGMFINPIQ